MIDRKVVHKCDGCGREEDGEKLFKELGGELGFEIEDGGKKPGHTKTTTWTTVTKSKPRPRKKRRKTGKKREKPPSVRKPVERPRYRSRPTKEDKDVKCPEGCGHRSSTIQAMYQHCWTRHREKNINTATIRRFNEKPPVQQANEERIKALEQSRENGGLYHCPRPGCPDQFVTRGGLEEHMEKAHGIVEEPDPIDRLIEKKRGFD